MLTLVWVIGHLFGLIGVDFIWVWAGNEWTWAYRLN